MNIRKTLLIVGIIIIVLLAITFGQKGKTDVATVETPSNEETKVKVAEQTPATPRKPSTSVTTQKPVASTPEPTRVFENGVYVNIVKLTNTGFVPQTVSVAPGESVRFVNASSGFSMRILSSEYNGLNQEKTVGKNGIYEANFPKIGTWTYHNGVNVGMYGVVTVR